MNITPEQQAAVAARLQLKRLEDSYTAQRDAILADIATAYRVLSSATSRYTALQNSVNGGELSAIADGYATDKIAMAGQDDAIQAQFLTTIATLETAQAIVFQTTGGRFIKGIDLPEEPEP